MCIVALVAVAVVTVAMRIPRVVPALMSTSKDDKGAETT